MDEGLAKYAQRLMAGEWLEEAQYADMIRFRDARLAELLCEYAARTKKQQSGEEIRWLGTIDLSSYCKNNCYYCGLRRDNRFVKRYRMSTDEVVQCCRRGLEQGITRYLIQGGDDLWYTPDRIGEMIRQIRHLSTDVDIYLALGEKSRAVYQKWKAAGAKGYILCHQTAEDRAYHRLHPGNMSLLRRKQCLWELKELGYMVGSGFMIGTPYQRVTGLAEEFSFLRQLAPDMMVLESFIATEGTPFEKERNGMMDLVYFMTSLLRLSFPGLHMPVGQTVQMMDREGTFRAIQAGADMVPVDLTPLEQRNSYHCCKKTMMRGRIGVEDMEFLQGELQKVQ